MRSLLPLLVAMLACTSPLEHVVVVPAISGVVRRNGQPLEGAKLRRTYRSMGTPDLGGRDDARSDGSGRFAFEPVATRVAGREYDKRYMVLLKLVGPGGDRELWRLTYDRTALPPPFALACETEGDGRLMACRGRAAR